MNDVGQRWSIDMWGPFACAPNSNLQLIKRLLEFRHFISPDLNLSMMQALEKYEQIPSDSPDDLHYKLPKGTLLYRVPDSLAMTGSVGDTASNNVDSLTAARCTDTHKRGLYFATSPYIPLGMLVELHKVDDETLHELGTFEVTKDITLIYGKYTQVDRNPSHLDCGAFPLAQYGHNRVFFDVKLDWGCEVFLNSEDLEHIKFKDKIQYTAKEADDEIRYTAMKAEDELADKDDRIAE